MGSKLLLFGGSLQLGNRVAWLDLEGGGISVSEGTQPGAAADLATGVQAATEGCESGEVNASANGALACDTADLAAGGCARGGSASCARGGSASCQQREGRGTGGGEEGGEAADGAAGAEEGENAGGAGCASGPIAQSQAKLSSRAACKHNDALSAQGDKSGGMGEEPELGDASKMPRFGMPVVLPSGSRPPGARMSAVMALVGTKVWVYGGWIYSEGEMGDLYQLQLGFDPPGPSAGRGGGAEAARKAKEAAAEASRKARGAAMAAMQAAVAAASAGGDGVVAGSGSGDRDGVDEDGAGPSTSRGVGSTLSAQVLRWVAGRAPGGMAWDEVSSGDEEGEEEGEEEREGGRREGGEGSAGASVRRLMSDRVSWYYRLLRDAGMQAGGGALPPHLLQGMHQAMAQVSLLRSLVQNGDEEDEEEVEEEEEEEEVEWESAEEGEEEESEEDEI